MKRTLTLTLMLLFSLLAMIQGYSQIRPFSIRYSKNSVRGNIRYISNSIIGTVGGTTTDVPPSGTATNNSNVGEDIDIDNPAPTTFFDYSAVWKYYDTVNAAKQPYLTNWNTTGYNDAIWKSGAGQLGYGDGDETTVIGYGGNASNKYISSYFRKVVNVPDPTIFTEFILNVHRDDGIIIYVNGVEVGRNNLPAGAISYTTTATNASDDGNSVIPFHVPISNFVAGNNTIAVEIHQTNNTSSDLSFDMQMLGVFSNETWNSSSADLDLLSCSEVLFAGLYWGAGQGNSGSNTTWITGGEDTCLLKVPGAGSYVKVTASQVDYHNNTVIPGYTHTGYKCFADITSLINTTSPNGTYVLANVTSPAGIGDAYGGWTIVIVFRNSSLPIRNLTVFDGNELIKSGSAPVDVAISGFLTPPSGAVSCELGAVVYDGDRGSKDSFAFKQNGAGSFYNLAVTSAVPTSGNQDMWNSTIAYKGVVVATRNPAYNNTLGYDANIIDLPNAGNAQLGNNKTSATVRFASPSENYIAQVLTTSISQYNPSFSVEKTSTDLNGGSLAGGDILRYTINFSNLGNDASTNSTIIDNLPFNTGYVPGSLKIDGVAQTDGSGDDQAEYDMVNRKVTFRVGTGANSGSGGSVASSGTGSVTFDVVVSSSCYIIACGGDVRNSARIDYAGQTTGDILYDSSVHDDGSGCYAPGPVTNTIGSSCYSPGDTTLVNICPSPSITLPWAQYAGYTFYSAKPFISANIFDPTTAISASGVYWAYVTTPGGCSDTIKITVLHQNCPDLDEDNDGIPDYVEINDPLALQDADSDGTPNWLDTDYPGWADNNSDGLNDRFDPGADYDNDGIVNFMDSDFPGYVDANGDHVNDNMDADEDAIPDFLDRDSDNDGIPDVVESGGVDANGDGVIDNFTDPDADGLSQNVDLSSGVAGSGNGLGALDLDGDGIPNYRDLDSDNDGVPDVREVNGTDSDNDGMVDGFTDSDLDGFSDNVDGDMGNDGTAENSAAALLRTGADVNNDGKADSYPYANFDGDTRANPYDSDSDNDGISDCREAGFTDADSNGQSDGTKGSDGWDDTISAQGSLTLPNSDGSGNPDMLDIDSDDDGIPDNVEGISTSGYQFPTYLDTDGDGLDDRYDNISGFGGGGITPNDQDADGTPDYRDTDTDNDGVPDIVEGNDYNLNEMADDVVTLAGTDTDGDGLDDRFDADNSSQKGTSQYMGTLGSTSGDGSPGSNTMVQQSSYSVGDRDWRWANFALPIDFLSFTGKRQDEGIALNWVVTCTNIISAFEIERSTDGVHFSKVGTVKGPDRACSGDLFQFNDPIDYGSGQYYYRIHAISVDGKSRRSDVILIRLHSSSSFTIMPNPASSDAIVSFVAPAKGHASVVVLDQAGQVVMRTSTQVNAGTARIYLDRLDKLAPGLYLVKIKLADAIMTQKLIIGRR